MAAHDPKGTERWYLVYDVGTDRHTMMIRTADGRADNEMASLFSGMLTILSPILYTTVPIRLERSLKGSNVRLPRSTTGLAASYGSAVPNGAQSVYGLAFPGRSQLGAKARVYVIPVKLQGDNNYRYNLGENSAVDGFISTLNDGGGVVFLGIDGQTVNWYNYATSKQNDHYVDERRGS